MRRKVGPVLSVGAGVAVMTIGRWAMAHLPAVGAFADALTGSAGVHTVDGLANVLPGGALCGIALLLVGALLIARELGLPAGDEGGSSPRLVLVPHVPRAAVGCIAAAALLAVAATALLFRVQPPASAVILWALAPLPAFVAAVIVDRRRGTGFGNPLPRAHEWLFLAMAVAAALVLAGHDLAHWRWSGTTDEAFFFVAAKALATGELRAFPLSEDGVFGFHPVLSSYYQAGFMRLFGMNVVGWRLSSVAALALALPPAYVLARELSGRRAAMIAVALFASAQLAVGYAHFGYNNVQIYPAVMATLAALAWAVRRDSLAAFFLAGWCGGMSCFTYFTARLGLLLMPLLAWAIGGVRQLRADRAARAALLGGVFLTAFPVLIRGEESVARMLRLTGATGGREDAASGAVLAWLWESRGRIGSHWLLSVFHGVWSESGQLQFAPVVDPITSSAAAVGLLLGGGLLLRHRRDFLTPSYVLSAFAVGAVSPYPRPALTRLLFLAPFTAMLAGRGIDQLVRRFDGGRLVTLLAAGLVAAGVAWNVVALHDNVYRRAHGYGNGRTAELIRVVQTLPDSTHIIFVQWQPLTVTNIDNELAVYGMRERLAYAKPLPEDVRLVLAKTPPPLVVAYDLSNDTQRVATEETLTRQFPGLYWRNSEGGQPWNVRYFFVPEKILAANERE